MRPATPLAERIARYIYREPMSGCWLWTGSCTHNGYGQTNLHVARDVNKHIGAHVASWIVHNGDVPMGAHVLHKCDVRCCVNPSHLFLGDRSDNMQDCLAKGRFSSHGSPGETNPRATLTAAAVEKIRAEYVRGTTRQVDLAKKYGIGQSQISRVIRGEHWQS
jgi:hypothetical protein